MPPKPKRTEAEQARQMHAAREKALYARRLKQSHRLRGELAVVDAHLATYETAMLGTLPEAPAEPSYRGPAVSTPTAAPPPAPAPTPVVSAPPPPPAAPAPTATEVAPPCAPTASVASPSASWTSDAESVDLPGGESWMSVAESVDLPGGENPDNVLRLLSNAVGRAHSPASLCADTVPNLVAPTRSAEAMWSPRLAYAPQIAKAPHPPERGAERFWWAR